MSEIWEAIQTNFVIILMVTARISGIFTFNPIFSRNGVPNMVKAGADGVAVYSGQRYLLTEMFRLTEQDLLALFERHGYDLVLLEGFKDSGWPKIEVVRKEISDTPVSFQPLAVVGDIPGADFGLEDAQALADWLVAQMPGL